MKSRHLSGWGKRKKRLRHKGFLHCRRIPEAARKSGHNPSVPQSTAEQENPLIGDVGAGTGLFRPLVAGFEVNSGLTRDPPLSVSQRRV
jgi:hypothetical protein